jgi:hypothetical protein
MPRVEQARTHEPAHATDADKTEMLTCHNCLELLVNVQQLSAKRGAIRHTRYWHNRI